MSTVQVYTKLQSVSQTILKVIQAFIMFLVLFLGVVGSGVAENLAKQVVVGKFFQIETGAGGY